MKPSSLRLIIFSFLVLTLLTGPGVPVRGVRCSGGARIPGGGGCASGARAVKVPPSVVKIPIKPPPTVVKNISPKIIPPVREPVIPGRIPNRQLPGQLPGIARGGKLLPPILPAPLHPPPAELPGAATEALAGLKIGESNLEALSSLRNVVHDSWPENLRIEDVSAAFDGFAKTSPQEAEAMRGYLSVRARMEGRPDVAAKFVPKGETSDAKSVLRDLKAMEDLGAKPPSELPWGDLPLPEAEPFGLKAPVLEELDKDLPGLVPELAAAEVRARRVALRSIDAGAETHVYYYHLHLHNLMHSVNWSERDKREDEVERRVDKLTPEERLMARRLLRTKGTDEIVTILRPAVGK
jgi:hypothetical protein